LLALPEPLMIEGLPEDFTERLDDYLYGGLLEGGGQQDEEAVAQ